MSMDFLCSAATVGGAIFVLWCVWSLCWGVVPFTAKARRKKEAKTVLAAARTFILSYEDLPAYRDGGEFGVRMRNLRDAWKARNVEECRSLLGFLDPPKPCAAGREWLDILVVSISVAMAFRAYFYEPFNIPTGSMQPTLYGNHTLPCSPLEATVWDKGPQKYVKWLFTGKMYECFEAPFDGYLWFGPTKTGHYDMRVVQVGTTGEVIRKSGPMLVPTDVLNGIAGDVPAEGRGGRRGLPNGLTYGSRVRAGQVLWSGYVVTGDFLFVNRWLWNFRHPRRGDVMIFNTTGIGAEAQSGDQRPMAGTHYIKRMTGTPGERLELVQENGRDGDGAAFALQVDGTRPMEPERIAQIQRREKFCPEAARPYAGYLPGPLIAPGLPRQLGPDEYWACGDNSENSLDSRYWGPVPAKNLCGIAGGVFWPFSHRWGQIR